MKTIGLLQHTYQTSDHISTPALTHFFGVVDAAGALGYTVNHSNQPNRLMVDPDHLYDVGEALGYPIKHSKPELLNHLSRLVWPRYVGINEFKTSIWPSAKRVTCWTFDLNKSESNMNQTFQNNRLENDQTLIEHLNDVQSQLGVWRDTLLSLPPDSQVSFTASELANVLSAYYEQIGTAKTKI
ncbi:MAG: hypothetical protein VXW16_04715 [Bacteroidota bacterium]|nr:hypothetical protein [Bacteroidota bacterium]MEC8568916.1 hypothetical protein [Pseudomonadota bacterium]